MDVCGGISALQLGHVAICVCVCARDSIEGDLSRTRCNQLEMLSNLTWRGGLVSGTGNGGSREPQWVQYL